MTTFNVDREWFYKGDYCGLSFRLYSRRASSLFSVLVAGIPAFSEKLTHVWDRLPGGCFTEEPTDHTYPSNTAQRCLFVYDDDGEDDE